MVNITVRVVGLKELERKLDGKLLVQPEIEEGLDTINARFMRGGKGLGVRRNVLNSQRAVLSRRVSSTRVWPRTRGTAWKSKNIGAFRGMAARVIQKIVRGIRARWTA